jgi:hypothetical protein
LTSRWIFELETIDVRMPGGGETPRARSDWVEESNVQESSREEEWRDIPQWASIYQVSDHGRVRSLPRLVESRNTTTGKNFTTGQYLTPGRILKPDWSSGGGYARVRLRRYETDRKLLVHRLVLLAFVGEPTPPADLGCHNDGDVRNNLLRNLRWDTASSNMDDKLIHGTNPYTNQEVCKRNHLLAEPNLTAYYRQKTKLTGRSQRSCGEFPIY